MIQKGYILMLAFAAITTGTYAQSHNTLNERPANVKVCRSTSPKKLKEMIFYKADGTSHQRFNYEYDAAGIKISESEQKWDRSANAWKDYQKKTYTYNSDNKLTESISEYHTADGWINLSKKTPVYSADGIATKELCYYWNTANNEWDAATIKNTYTFDENGYVTEFLAQHKEASAEEWNTFNEKITYTRNPAGQVTEELLQYFNKETGEWNNSFKYVYEYESTEHKMTALVYKWTNNQWSEYNKTICSYDKDGDLERADYYRSFDDSSLDAYCIYTYTTSSSGETGTAEIISEAITIYPNPATSYINIKTTPAFLRKTAYLYDTTGKLVNTVLIDNNIVRMDIASLSNGIYYIKIENQTNKIVKQ